MKVAPALRIGLTALGILIVIGAFVGVTAAGAVNNKPPLHIAVTSKDIAPGEHVTPGDIRIVDQSIDPGLAHLYVQEFELPQYANAVALDQLRRGDPLNKVKLTTDGEGAASRRYALALKNPDDVVMVLPVSPDIIPPNVIAGDAVNVNFVVGSTTSINQMPVESASANMNGSVGAAGDSNSYTAPESAAGRTITLGTQATISTQNMADLLLPIADLMLERVPVLDVVHDQVQNVSNSVGPGASGEGNNPPAFVDGVIKAIVVRVPARFQTILSFAATTGKLRFSIASPAMTDGDIKPNGVVDWKGMSDLLRWKQAQSLLAGESLTRTIYPNYVAPTSSASLTTTQTVTASMPAQLPTPAPASAPANTTKP